MKISVNDKYFKEIAIYKFIHGSIICEKEMETFLGSLWKSKTNFYFTFVLEKNQILWNLKILGIFGILQIWFVHLAAFYREPLIRFVWKLVQLGNSDNLFFKKILVPLQLGKNGQ